ncbi:MAG: T9SS type A sorting domain-containing protein, partial [Bacteroidetes bacterium]|nr:T9SS type A sorting domain-containing protein [Bacteroidota bacterium]
AAGGGGGAWSGGGGGGGSSYGGTLTNVTYSAGIQTGNGQVIIYGFSGGCISASRTAVSFTVNPTPTVTASSSASLICSGQTATLTASGATTYSWNTTATTTAIAVSPTTTTSYTVTGTSASNCVAAATISQSVSACTGIAGVNSSEALSIKIYPNPNKGDFMISAETNLTLSLVNSLGQVVKIITLNSQNNYKAQVNDLANGIYFIVGDSGHQLISQKIIVSK